MVSCGKELFEDLKKTVALQKDGVGYNKITKTLKLFSTQHPVLSHLKFAPTL